jgi:hypothetical protein
MKKLLLTLLTALMLTGSVWAEWVKIDSNNDSDFYIDPETIRKAGNIVRAWEIQNLKQQAKRGELSRRYRMEYDCTQERNRILSISTHSGPMASGTTLMSFSASDQWDSIPPNTVSETVLKIVCAK